MNISEFERTDLWHRMTAIAHRVGQIELIRGIQQGYVLMVAGAVMFGFSDFLLHLPVPRYEAWLSEGGLQTILLYRPLHVIHGGIANYGSLFLGITIAYSFSRIWKLGSGHDILLPVMALAGMFLSQQVPDSEFVLEDVSAAWNFDHSLNMLIYTLGAVYSYKFLYDKTSHITLTKLSAIYLPNLKTTLNAIPMFVVMAFGFTTLHFLMMSYVTGGLRLQEFLLQHLGAWLLSIESDFWRLAVYSTMADLLNFFGIHAEQLLGDLWNFFAYSAEGGSVGYDRVLDQSNFFLTREFSMLAYPGGAGASLGLVIAILLFGKYRLSQSLAKLSLLPSLVNCADIILYSLPMACNICFLIPMLLVPMVGNTVAYELILHGVIPYPAHVTAMSVPPVMFGYLATGSWAAAVFQVGMIVFSTAVYSVFLRLHESAHNEAFVGGVKSYVHELQKAEAAQMPLAVSKLDRELRIIHASLTQDLKRAIETGGLYLSYQPQFDIYGNFVSAEALLRWRHEIAGFIYPPLIIHLAKAGDFLPELEKFLLNRACKQIAELNAMTSHRYGISVNLTGSSLLYDDLEHNIGEAVYAYGIPPQQITFEITEQDAVNFEDGDGTDETASSAVKKLDRIREMGHHLAIDDFGMGHTSITYLMSGKFAEIKLDGSITKLLMAEDDKGSAQIIKSLTRMASDLGLKVVAEYVETCEQRDQLRMLGVNLFQGWYYSRDIPMDKLILLAQEQDLKHEKKEAGEVSNVISFQARRK